MPKVKLTTPNPRDVIPRNIKIFMAMRGVSTDDIAKRCGCTRSTVQKWLRGEIVLDVIRLDQIAAILKTTPAALYSPVQISEPGENAMYIGG